MARPHFPGTAVPIQCDGLIWASEEGKKLSKAERRSNTKWLSQLLNEDTIDYAILTWATGNPDLTLIGLDNRPLGQDISANVVRVAGIVNYIDDFCLLYFPCRAIGHRDGILSEHSSERISTGLAVVLSLWFTYECPLLLGRNLGSALAAGQDLPSSGALTSRLTVPVCHT